MKETARTAPQLEDMARDHHHHLLCWKSTAGGVLIAIMAFMTLSSLGAAIAGHTAESMINREQGGSALASGAGLWLGLSAVISLFCGSYFALRISRFKTNKIGAAHGFVVASIFFILLFIGAGNVIGGLAQGFGSLAKGAGSTASQLSSSPAVQDTLNRVIGSSTQLKSPPSEVAQGLAVRLLQGDTESAKNYYAYQSGLPQAEVDQKVAQLKADFDAALKTAGEKAANAVGDTGLSMFVVFLAGLIGAVVGGRVGAHANNDRPFAVTDRASAAYGTPVLANQRGGVMPYVFGWLLGVPVSILLLIAMLRAIF